MRFSWTGLLLAPLPAPLLFSIAMTVLLSANHPELFFLMMLIPSCVVSYGATIGLFLPCLFVMSLWWQVRIWHACLLGFGLGAAVMVPLTFMAWLGSGPDSGPPVEGFLTFFVRWAADPLSAIYPLAGLITSGLYWTLGTWRQGRRADPAPTAPGAAV